MSKQIKRFQTHFLIVVLTMYMWQQLNPFVEFTYTVKTLW